MFWIARKLRDSKWGQSLDYLLCLETKWLFKVTKSRNLPTLLTTVSVTRLNLIKAKLITWVQRTAKIGQSFFVEALLFTTKNMPSHFFNKHLLFAPRQAIVRLESAAGSTCLDDRLMIPAHRILRLISMSWFSLNGLLIGFILI